MFGLKARRQKKLLRRTMMARNLVTAIDTKSIISEQFRTIRTNISFMTPSTRLKTILITSSIPGEGKSTTAANMGVVFAQEGKKVLLVDGDMRKPTLHHTFKADNETGLSSLLASKHTAAEVIQETFLVGLDLVTSGPIPSNPAELLSSSTLESFLEEVKAQYDVILFDGPPLVSVPDAHVLANRCDGTVLVVHAGIVDRSVALKVKTILKTAQANTLGVVLNNYELPSNQHYYYGSE